MTDDESGVEAREARVDAVLRRIRLACEQVTAVGLVAAKRHGFERAYLSGLFRRCEACTFADCPIRLMCRHSARN